MEHLHPYPGFEANLSPQTEMRIIMDVSLEEAVQFLYYHSPLKDSGYERVSTDLKIGLGKINNELRKGLDGPEFRTEYILGVVGCDFLAPTLGVDVENEREDLCRILNNEYKIKDPLDVHFVETYAEGENGELRIIKLGQIIEIIKQEHKQFLKHDPSQNFKDRVYNLTLESVGELQKKYSLDNYVRALGLYLLSSALGNNPDRGGLCENFDKATEGKPSYILISNANFKSEEEE